MEWIGGHPFLLKHALYTLVTRRWTVDELIKVAVSEDGPFIAHLRKLRDRARGVKSIGDAFEAIQAGETIDDDVLFDKLWAAGLVRGQARGEVAFRYKLYTEYFSKHPL